VNCGAIPPSLFESELFGYERGAFSGALQNYKGLIRSAHGGTLFLDEVGELDLPLQVKLLRWLDSGEVRPLGSTRFETAQTRLLAATNVDLVQAVAEGKFRLDLYERLSVLTLRIPPLRERKRDIALLAQSILAGHGISIEMEELRFLEEFYWPGNIRQLRNVLLRAVARGQGKALQPLLRTILEEEQNFVQSLQRGINHGIFDSSLAQIEKQAILDRIQRCQGNKKRAARELGIAKSTLHEKIRRWKSETQEEFPALGSALLGT
jgi:transcriptional regulator with PAS, ATPase and Fis domain